MIRAEQRDAVRHPIFGGVAELISGARRQHSAAYKVAEISIEGDLTQHQHDLESPQHFHFAIKKGRAVGKLFSRRLVIRWRTTSYRGDVEVRQLQAIAAMCSSGLG